MICVERLNGEILYLNWLQVELIEQIPETKIRMMNGDYYLVMESIKDQVTGFFKRCVSIKKEEQI
jgi:flagellar protein FlbD